MEADRPRLTPRGEALPGTQGEQRCAARWRRVRLHAGVDHELRRRALAKLEAGVPGALAERVGERAVAEEGDEPPVARAPGGRRRRIRVPVGPILRILVPAAAGLPSEPAGGDHARLQRARPPARLTEGELRERLGDLEAHVDSHQVHELEGAHGEAPAEAADAVDLLVAGHPLLEQPQRLPAEGPCAAVDEESRPVGRDDHLLAHRLACGARHLEGTLAGLVGPDQLEQAHQGRRVEEVHADHVLGPRGHAGERRDRDRGGVGGEHRVGAHDPREALEERALEVGALGRGLDHELARRELLERGDRLEAPRGVRARAPLLDPLRETAANRERTPLERLFDRIV